MADFAGDPYPTGMYVRHQIQRDRARKLEVSMGEQVPGAQRTTAELASDERGANHLHENSFNTPGHFSIGKIVYSVPYSHWYRVMLEGGQACVPCCRVTDGSAAPFGTRDSAILTPNTKVLVYKHTHGTYGIIIGALPEIVPDSNFVHPDWISQGSNVGFKRERYYWELMTLCEERGGLIDFSNDRPVDGTAFGEWGRCSHTGSMTHMDPWMTMIRHDDTTGLWLFYMDRLARLCGYNMDIRNAGGEESIRNDQGEIHGFRGWTGFYWNTLGAFGPKDTPHREESDQDVQYKKPFSKYEPKHDDQMSFYRTEEYRGYCGQGFMRQVMLHPAAKKTGINRYPDKGPENSRIGVFRESIGYDGSLSVTSAHSIQFQKRLLIPIPKRTALVEDEKDGDRTSWENGDNYKFASEFGGGPKHKVSNPKANDEQPHILTAHAMIDLHAYAFNWKAIHPFVYHEKDYWTPQEKEIPPFEKLLKVPSFGTLSGKTFMERPEPKKVWVDSRYEEQEYWETTAGWSITPDGCIVIRDAYGFELKTGGGNGYLSLPGDLYLQPGRNMVVYGGDDIVLKAQKSVDVTASQNDVRIKGEVNVDILAGNNGKAGRLLLECQASGIIHQYERKKGEDVIGSGVLIKARNSQFAAMATQVYLRTGSVDGGIAAGDIVLDADKGRRDIRTISRVMNNHVEVWTNDALPSQGGKKVVHSWSAILACIPTPLECKGLMVLCDHLMMKGNIFVAGGHIFTEKSPQYYFLVGPPGEWVPKTYEAVETSLATFKENNAKLAKDFKEGIKEQFWDEGKIGNPKIQKALEFAPRTPKQQDTLDWKLPENYWQQLARLGGQQPGTWTESPIIYQGETMMPHPGKAKWAEEPTWLTLDLKYHDVGEGRDKDHGVSSVYPNDPNLESWKRKTPQGNYIVVNT